MKTRIFTAGVLLRGGNVLIMKRKDQDDTYPGLWDLVGGHFEEGESAEACMIREASEESHLDVRPERAGHLIEYTDEYGRAIAVPFLLSSRSENVVLSEHSEYRWVPPAALVRYRSVPALGVAVRDFGLTGMTQKGRESPAT